MPTCDGLYGTLGIRNFTGLGLSWRNSKSQIAPQRRLVVPSGSFSCILRLDTQPFYCSSWILRPKTICLPSQAL